MIPDKRWLKSDRGTVLLSGIGHGNGRLGTGDLYLLFLCTNPFVMKRVLDALNELKTKDAAGIRFTVDSSRVPVSGACFSAGWRAAAQQRKLFQRDDRRLL